ncbi:coiled-coil domain-containing protein [Phyllobacterium leguminum]|uniref:Uncharacterized protein DUF1640 n=1 Tax=Phyllobacterium leguminum TaxID=314237 RepID=A0A318T717_9HYPH|nr:coiled-coil domain-containing protein [Phyllobacterium leguminum]PYE88905.1 uncharacterized protein DUF1640 [Phyllobacterium leguminum]
MAIVFDTLGYSTRLRKDGFTQEQADALSFAARDYIMPELVTKSDLQAATAALQGDLQTATSTLRGELQAATSELRGELQAATSELRSDMQAATSELRSDMQAATSELRSDMQALRGDMQALRVEVHAAIDSSSLKTVIITGGMVTAAVGIMLTAIPIILK